MYVQKMRLCMFLIALVVILQTCEAKGRGFSGFRSGGRSYSSYSRSRSGGRSHSSYSRSRIGHDTYSTYSRSRSGHDTVSTHSSSRFGHDTYRSKVGHGIASRAPVRIRPVTARPKVTFPTAGPDIGFRKVNNGRNYYQSPPTLKPLYPKQNYYSTGAYHQSPPVITNQPVYVNPYTYHNNQDNTLLGTYLGYQMGSHVHGHNYYHSHDYSDNNNIQPRYAVVHHYHHYDKPIPKEIQVEKDIIGECGNLTGFCTSNTSALCLTNGTVYCLAPQEITVPCIINSTVTSCVNSAVTMPCINNTNCAPENSNVTTIIRMPCISYISLNTDIHNVSTSNVDKKDTAAHSSFNDTVAHSSFNDTVAHSSFNDTAAHSSLNDTDYMLRMHKKRLEKLMAVLGITPPPLWNRFKREVKSFCVTLIAEPLLISKNMTNEEFLAHVQRNEDTKNFVEAKHLNLFQHFLSLI